MGGSYAPAARSCDSKSERPPKALRLMMGWYRNSRHPSRGSKSERPPKALRLLRPVSRTTSFSRLEVRKATEGIATSSSGRWRRRTPPRSKSERPLKALRRSGVLLDVDLDVRLEVRKATEGIATVVRGAEARRARRPRSPKGHRRHCDGVSVGRIPTRRRTRSPKGHRRHCDFSGSEEPRACGRCSKSERPPKALRPICCAADRPRHPSSKSERPPKALRRGYAQARPVDEQTRSPKGHRRHCDFLARALRFESRHPRSPKGHRRHCDFLPTLLPTPLLALSKSERPPKALRPFSAASSVGVALYSKSERPPKALRLLRSWQVLLMSWHSKSERPPKALRLSSSAASRARRGRPAAP